ncbi:MAG: CBS domain-containing protein, partial [Burkholderiaceae bacterium]
QADPATRHETRDPVPTARLGITTEDLDAVLARYNQVLDISREDLQTILVETEMQAYQRRFGITRCADVMSRDVRSVMFGSELQEAWDILHKHRLTALPVVDRGNRVVGIITKADFVAHAKANTYARLGRGLQTLLQPIRHTHSIKPEVVGQIMHADVRTAHQEQPVVELVPLMSDAGLHSIPIVDEERRLVGMITQSDMIATLYEKNLGQPVRAARLAAISGR